MWEREGILGGASWLYMAQYSHGVGEILSAESESVVDEPRHSAAHRPACALGVPRQG